MPAAIGLPSEYTSGALRVTFGEFNSKWEIDYLVKNKLMFLYTFNNNICI